MDEIVKDLTELSQEEKEQAWSEHIREQVNNLLDLFLDPSKDCNLNVKYRPAVKEVLESGPVYDSDSYDAAQVTLVFEFKEPVSLTTE